MAADETSRDHGGATLAGLLGPLRLPGRVIELLEALAEAARELSPMRLELKRVREQTEPLGELIPALERLIKNTEPLSELLPALESLKQELKEQLEGLQEVIVELEGERSHLNVTAGKLVDELVAMHKTVTKLEHEVHTVTERMPDASRSPLEKAKDVLSGGAASS